MSAIIQTAAVLIVSHLLILWIRALRIRANDRRHVNEVLNGRR